LLTAFAYLRGSEPDVTGPRRPVGRHQQDFAMAEAQDAGPKKKSGKLVLIMLATLILLGGGGAAAVFMGLIPLGTEADAAEAQGEMVPPPPDPSEIIFVDLPEVLVNLNVTGSRLRFLKFGAALEVAGEEQAELVRQFVPRIADNIHMYLRAVEPEELAGPDGVFRVKRDLLSRINQVSPAHVRDVLIKDMLVQ
jgi:flagellar FliL protein